MESDFVIKLYGIPQSFQSSGLTILGGFLFGILAAFAVIFIDSCKKRIKMKKVNPEITEMMAGELEMLLGLGDEVGEARSRNPTANKASKNIDDYMFDGPGGGEEGMNPGMGGFRHATQNTNVIASAEMDDEAAAGSPPPFNFAAQEHKVTFSDPQDQDTAQDIITESQQAPAVSPSKFSANVQTAVRVGRLLSAAVSPGGNNNSNSCNNNNIASSGSPKFSRNSFSFRRPSVSNNSIRRPSASNSMRGNMGLGADVLDTAKRLSMVAAAVRQQQPVIKDDDDDDDDEDEEAVRARKEQQAEARRASTAFFENTRRIQMAANAALRSENNSNTLNVEAGAGAIDAQSTMAGENVLSDIADNE